MPLNYSKWDNIELSDDEDNFRERPGPRIKNRRHTLRFTAAPDADSVSHFTPSQTRTSTTTS